MDRAVLVRLQAPLEPGGVRRGQQSPRALHPHLATGHRPLQQVRHLSFLDNRRFRDNRELKDKNNSTLIASGKSVDLSAKSQSSEPAIFTEVLTGTSK